LVLPSGPASPSERIVSIDVLRGVALLGILVMNIQDYSMIGAAYFNPTAYGDLTGANLMVWLFSHFFADQKFMTIFSMLFGAGIFLMSQRAASSGRRPAGLHYRRMLWLVIFGLLHAYLLWRGDILFMYGMCGLAVYLFRKLRPGWLLALGTASLCCCSALWLLFGWSMQFWPQAALTDFVSDWRPGAEMVAHQVAVYQSGWVEQMALRVPEAVEFQTMAFLLWGFWRAGGLMLIGIALFKLGVFSAERSRRFYLSLIVPALLVGLPAIIFGVYRHFEADWDATYSFFTGTVFNYWGSILVSLGYVGAVMLIVRAGTLKPLTQRLAAVGRMALSMYLLQTIICTTIFYGHGFGFFGRVERLGQITIVAVMVLLQLWLAPLWLSRFRFGPFEWSWRSLTYLRLQPMRPVVKTQDET
jgi:uncharacterized protein